MSAIGTQIRRKVRRMHCVLPQLKAKKIGRGKKVKTIQVTLYILCLLLLRPFLILPLISLSSKKLTESPPLAL